MSDTKDVRKFAFINGSSEGVPPFAVMAVVLSTDEENEVTFTIRKPNAVDEQAQDPATLVFNLGELIPAGKTGLCTTDFPCQALAVGTIVAGAKLGPKSNSWHLEPVSGNAFVAKVLDATAPHTESSAVVWYVEVNTSEVEMVLLTAATTDADGYYPGVVQRYNTATNTWSNVRTCRVKDANY